MRVVEGSGNSSAAAAVAVAAVVQPTNLFLCVKNALKMHFTKTGGRLFGRKKNPAGMLKTFLSF